MPSVRPACHGIFDPASWLTRTAARSVPHPHVGVWNLIRFVGPCATSRNHLPVRDYRYAIWRPGPLPGP